MDGGTRSHDRKRERITTERERETLESGNHAGVAERRNDSVNEGYRVLRRGSSFSSRRRLRKESSSVVCVVCKLSLAALSVCSIRTRTTPGHTRFVRRRRQRGGGESLLRARMWTAH